MDSNDDHRPLAAADDDDEVHILGDSISRSLNLELPPYWNEGPKANWLHLPRDVLTTILLKLSAIEIIDSAQNVCTLWRSVCMDPSLWTHIDMRIVDGDMDMSYYDLANMCRHAIDRSRGGCVDINIKYFGDDDLLNYIVESDCKLRRLRLERCWSVSDEGMAKAAQRLPFLETFEYYQGNLGENALKAIGKNCPHLTTLVFEQEIGLLYNRGKDNEAFAIAELMPGLRRLSLSGNKLTNKGLGAILDSCPHLESLDLRQCIKVDVMGDLAKKCELIKDLKRPCYFIACNDDYDSDLDSDLDSDYTFSFDCEDYDAELSDYYSF